MILLMKVMVLVVMVGLLMVVTIRLVMMAVMNVLMLVVRVMMVIMMIRVIMKMFGMGMIAMIGKMKPLLIIMMMNTISMLREELACLQRGAAAKREREELGGTQPNK